MVDEIVIHLKHDMSLWGIWITQFIYNIISMSIAFWLPWKNRSNVQEVKDFNCVCIGSLCDGLSMTQSLYQNFRASHTLFYYPLCICIPFFPIFMITKVLKLQLDGCWQFIKSIIPLSTMLTNIWLWSTNACKNMFEKGNVWMSARAKGAQCCWCNQNISKSKESPICLSSTLTINSSYSKPYEKQESIFTIFFKKTLIPKRHEGDWIFNVVMN